MKRFTYIEYLKYQEYIENIKFFRTILKENNESYQYSSGKIYHKHDKIFREILEDPKEVATLINRVLKIENKKEALKEKDIEKYNRKFITNNFKYAETDVIYKKKTEDIFFLIEHQSTIDYSMPYRILMYSLEIMKSTIDEKQLKKKSYKFPMVYPIIVYTGNRKWNVEKYIEAKQQKIVGYEPTRFYEYNIIDINQFSEKELLKDPTLLSKVMLLEKASNSQQMIEYLRKIIKGKLTEENIIFLKRILYYIFNKEIGEKESQNLLEKLEKKEGGKDMLEELLRKGLQEELEKIKKTEKKKAIEEGRKEGMEKGRKEGMEKGRKEGMEKGRKEGMEKGRKEGMEKGRKEGMEKGRKEGLEEGRREGLEEGKKEGIELGKKDAIEIVQQQIGKHWIINMIKNNIEEQRILEITEISKEQLQQIKNKIEQKTS